MSFGDFKSVQKVADKYNITTIKEDFTSKCTEFPLIQCFIDDINKGLKIRKSNSHDFFL